MKKILISAFFLVFLYSIGTTQTLNAWIKEGDKALQVQKDYYPAYKYYGIALEYDDSRTDVWYKYAEAACGFLAYSKAEPAYQIVLDSDSTGTFPLTALRLAEVKQRMGKYAEAEALYERFLTEQPNASAGNRAQAEKEKANCSWALGILGESTGALIKHLGEPVNSEYSDFAPVLKGDTLYYSSLKFEYERDTFNPRRVFSKVMRALNSGTGELLPGEFNQTGKHVSNAAFSTDGSTVYYSVCRYTGATETYCELFSSKRNSQGNWDPAKKLSVNVVGYSSTQPNVGIDPESGKKVLYFSSNRIGGRDTAVMDMDIWYTEINDNGSLGIAKNLVEANTNGDEITPFYNAFTKTLFFSSNGHQGLGGFDIFKLKRTSNGWLPAEHLGVPVNSSYDDAYYALFSEKSKALFSSNRPDSNAVFWDETREACCYDIYSVQVFDDVINLLALTFNELNMAELAGATVGLYEVTGTGEEKLITSMTNPESNDFVFPLEREKKYVIKATRPGYTSTLAELDLNSPEYEYASEIEKKLYLGQWLEATAFDDQTKAPLLGVTVELLEISDGDGLTFSAGKKTNENGNDFLFPLDLYKTYLIKATKDNYEPIIDTLRVPSELVNDLDGILEIQLFLKRKDLPITLYFENDVPDRRSRKATTAINYAQTNVEFYAQKREFINEAVDAVEDYLKGQTRTLFENFFEREVKGEYEKLKRYSEKLLTNLQKGKSYKLKLEGYASPRATTSYNVLLSERRNNSVINFFREYRNGALVEYIDSGKLEFVTEALGESAIRPEVVDQIKSEGKESIFGILASYERMVKIIDLSNQK